MDSVISKLKNTVSNAASSAASSAVSIASQVSNFLPGNPVTREYEVMERVGTAGRGKYYPTIRAH